MRGMNLRQPDRATGARVVVLAAAALFVVDLFLGWHQLSVNVVGVVGVEGTTSGWSDWGAAAGAAALAIVAWEIAAARSERVSPLAVAGITALLSGVVLAGTLQEFFAGDARVEVAGIVIAEAGERLWPAWVGLALALALVSAAALRVVVAFREASEAGRAPTLDAT